MPISPPVFRSRARPTRQEQNAEADARRGSARKRGYGAQWDRTSKLFKFQHPLCLGCSAVQRVTATEVTDHVVPHKGDMVAFWDSSKWQPACGWHHDVVKQRLEALFAKGVIKEADLWLNSARAIAMTLELDPR